MTTRMDVSEGGEPVRVEYRVDGFEDGKGGCMETCSACGKSLDARQVFAAGTEGVFCSGECLEAFLHPKTEVAVAEGPTDEEVLAAWKEAGPERFVARPIPNSPFTYRGEGRAPAPKDDESWRDRPPLF